MGDCFDYFYSVDYMDCKMKTKPKNYHRNWAIGYTLIALILAVAGYYRDSIYYYGAIVIGCISFYWIWGAWR